MILDKNEGDKYVFDYKNGLIKQGLGIGVPEVDDYLVYKQGETCIINGLDNVGKTYFMLWYYLCISLKWDKKFVLWCGENKVGAQKRDLVKMLAGRDLDLLNDKQIKNYLASINKRFQWISIEKMYNHNELFKIFSDSDADACLIDPFTGLSRDYDHKGNYDFLNASRQFVIDTKKTLYVNTHVNTEAARRLYPKDCGLDDLVGYPMPPEKSHSEGGQSFANRPDGFITIHRYPDHPTFWYNTLVFVRKVKDTGTGGKVSYRAKPLIFDFNKGLGFLAVVGDEKRTINPIADILKEKFGYEQEKLPFN